MEFSPLTVVVGANASGKSNLFDALQLLSRLAETHLKTAFREQRGEAIELFTQYGEGQYVNEMSFAVEMLVDRKVRDEWGGETELKYTRLRYELKIRRDKNSRGLDDLFVIHESLKNLKHGKEDHWVKRFISKQYLENWRPKVSTGKRGKPYIYTDDSKEDITIKLPQDGRQGGKETLAKGVAQTVLSGINSIDFPHAFAAREEIRHWKFLQLDPDALRQPSPYLAEDTLTQRGENLAAVLHRIKLNDEYTLKNISRKLNHLLPHFTELDVYDDKTTEKFVIKIRNVDGREFSSRVFSEGTLRLLTLCVFQYDETHQGLICFEEPENGIHPFRMKTMVQLLKDLSIDFSETDHPLRQIIVNTHSPIIVGEMFELRAYQTVSIWLSQLVTQITTIYDHKTKLHVTKMIPVVADSFQMELDFSNQFSEQEKKLTLSEVTKYLQSADFEETIKGLQ